MRQYRVTDEDNVLHWCGIGVFVDKAECKEKEKEKEDEEEE